MFGMGFGELVLVIIVAIVMIGPKDLPKVLRSLGQWAGRLRRMALDLRVQSGIDDVLRNEGLADDIREIRKLARGELDGIREAATIDLNAAGSVTGAASGATAGTTSTSGSSVATSPGGWAGHREVYPDGDSAALRVREYPREGVDSFDAMPDTAVVYVDSLPKSAWARDPLYAMGDAKAAPPAAPLRTPPPAPPAAPLRTPPPAPAGHIATAPLPTVASSASVASVPPTPTVTTEVVPTVTRELEVVTVTRDIAPNSGVQGHTPTNQLAPRPPTARPSAPNAPIAHATPPPRPAGTKPPPAPPPIKPASAPATPAPAPLKPAVATKPPAHPANAATPVASAPPSAPTAAPVTAAEAFLPTQIGMPAPKLPSGSVGPAAGDPTPRADRPPPVTGLTFERPKLSSVTTEVAVVPSDEAFPVPPSRASSQPASGGSEATTTPVVKVNPSTEPSPAPPAPTHHE